MCLFFVDITGEREKVLYEANTVLTWHRLSPAEQARIHSDFVTAQRLICRLGWAAYHQ